MESTFLKYYINTLGLRQYSVFLKKVCNKLTPIRCIDMEKLLLSFIILLFSFIGFSQSNDSLIVYFNFDSHSLNDASKKKMDDLKAKFESQNLELISITGFCDKSGTITYNQMLAQKRIDEVSAVLSTFYYMGNIKEYTIGERYTLPHSYKAKDFRKVVIVFSEVLTIVEDVPIEVIEKSTEAEKLTNKFVNFLQDSTVQEATIEISILFVPGQDVFLKESEPELWALYDFLNYNPTIEVDIHGHVCCSDDYELSVERAYAVYEFVTKRGVSPKRLSYEGHSNHQPAVSPELTEEDMKQNRRVSVVVKK